MKFSGQNSLSLGCSAVKIGDSSNHQTRCIRATGAGILEAMGKLEKLSELRRRAEFEKQIKLNLDSTTRLAIRLTGNWDIAEELVQETMLRAVRNWESFRHQSQFKTWLYRILINAFRDQLRRQSKAEFTQIEDTECPAQEATVQAKAEAGELGEIVADLIAQLPERQREVLVLTTYESLSSKQIATTLNINVANVHSNLSTARRKLKQQLRHYLDNG